MMVIRGIKLVRDTRVIIWVVVSSSWIFPPGILTVWETLHPFQTGDILEGLNFYLLSSGISVPLNFTRFITVHKISDFSSGIPLPGRTVVAKGAPPGCAEEPKKMVMTGGWIMIVLPCLVSQNFMSLGSTESLDLFWVICLKKNLQLNHESLQQLTGAACGRNMPQVSHGNISSCSWWFHASWPQQKGSWLVEPAHTPGSHLSYIQFFRPQIPWESTQTIQFLVVILYVIPLSKCHSWRS